MKKLRITVEGKSYDVMVELLDDRGAIQHDLPSRTGRQVEQLPLSTTTAAVVAPPATRAAPGDVTCPLSGKVIAVDVRVGDAVKVGDRLATLEAMKMFTHVFSTAAGRVASIQAKVGEALDEGSVILRIE